MIMISYVAFHDLHLYEEYREIIPEIMCTKVPDVYRYFPSLVLGATSCKIFLIPSSLPGLWWCSDRPA